MPSSGEAAPAREYLRALTTAIAAAPTDEQTGSYAFVHVKMWATDDTLRPGGTSTTDIVVYEERRWRAADGSGRVTRTRPPGERNGPPPGTENYGPGGLSGAVAEPVSTDPPILAGQLNGIQPFLMGPQAPVRAVADMYAWHYPDRDLRAALLRVLCDTDGLLWRGNTVDRAGRPGVAISVDSDNGGTRDIAVLDEHTGRLLAHETIRLRNPAGLTGPTPSLVSYVLYLEAGRRPAPA